MKKLFVSVILCLVGYIASAQFIYKIKADSVLITNDSCNAELIVENSTKNVCGFLFNKGKGRTEFRSALIKLNDSTYVVGCDTLHLHQGLITANNGLTTNTSTNVQLGGNLLHNTIINTDTLNLTISGSTVADSTSVLKIINNVGPNIDNEKYALSVVSPNTSAISVNTGGSGMIVNASGSALVAHTDGTAIVTYGNDGSIVAIGGSSVTNKINVSFTGGVGISASGTTGTGIQTTVTTGKAAIFTVNPSSTNTIVPIMDIYRKSSGTAANEIGGSIQYHIKTTNAAQDRISNTLISKWTNATDALRTSQFEVWGVNNGSAIARKLAIAGNGRLTLDGYANRAFYQNDTTMYKPVIMDSLGNVFQSSWLGGGGSITADNGLTANTSTNVRLGGTLVQNTTVDLDSNYFSINNGENPYFEIDPNGDRTFKFGDIANANNGTRFEINDNVGAVNIKSGSSYWLQISTSSDYSILETSNNAVALTGADHKVSLGDVYASGNSTKIVIDDAISKTSITKALRLSNYGSGTYSGTVSKYLAVDASGNVIETTGGSSSGWSLTGNSGLTAGTNFLGTTDNVSLVFKVNNNQSGKIDVSNSSTSFGYRSLLNNSAGENNEDGTNNTAIGYNALYSNTTGFDNTAVGVSALQDNTSGHRNTAIGYNALYSSNANNNTALGYLTLSSNTTGFSNTATGDISMFSNTTGYFNTATGAQALTNNTEGISNTADGVGALYNNTTGGYNTATGASALGSNTSGMNNIGVGYYAGFNNTSGSQNVFIGYNTGLGITTGSYNTIIGSNVSGLSSSLTSNIILADGQGNQRIRVDGNGRTGIGLTSPTAMLHLPAGTASSNTAPLKFTSGTNLSTPEAGAVEFDGSNYFVTSSTTRYTLAKTLTATGTLDFGSTSAGSSTDLTINVTGATDGDPVIVGVPNGSTLSNGVFTGWVSSSGVVTVRFTNTNTASALDPASGTFRVSVLHY